MSDDTVALMEMIGATSAVDPKTLPVRCRRAVMELVQSHLYHVKKAEETAGDARKNGLNLSDAWAFALAVRVMLRPEVQAVLIEEAERT